MPTSFDPETTSDLSKRAKAALRQRLGTLRTSLPAPVAAERSARIVQQLREHPLMQSAHGVGLYAAMLDKREVDLAPLHELLTGRGVRVYYPYMDPTPQGYTTGFRLWEAGDVLEKRGQYFVEPNPCRRVAVRGDIDLLVVPALGVTLQGYRLGFGAGFYDATLPDLCPPAKTICVGYDFQLLIELPVEPHDFRCDVVITDAGEGRGR